MSAAAPRIAVVTTAGMEYPDPEAPIVADALRETGVDAQLWAWDAPADWGGFDLVLVRSPWDYFDRLDQFLRWAEDVDAVTRIVNPANVIRWNSHKGYLADMGQRGVPALPNLLIPQGARDAERRLDGCGWDDVVIKPAVDGGARETLRARRSSAAARGHTARLAAAGDVVVQPYAAGVEAGETSLLFFGGEFSHAVRKVPAQGDYRVQAHHGGTEHRHEPTSLELETSQLAMSCAPGPLTYARVDLVEVDGVPTVMELEVIEPDLFFRADPASLSRFVTAVTAEL